MVAQLVLAAGFLLSAYLPGFLFMAAAAMFDGEPKLRDIVEAAFMALTLSPLSLIVALFAGFPTYVILSRLGWANLRSASVAGFVTGVLGGVLFGMPFEARAVVGHLGCGLLGLMGALTFWGFVVLSKRFKPSERDCRFCPGNTAKSVD